MREILFRGKRFDNGEWVEGFYNHLPCGRFDADEHMIQTVLENGKIGMLHDIDPSTVGQYTGLKDKNGKRIFEGDVCRFREWSNGEMCWVGKVHWEHQQFMISGGPNKECETMFELCMSRFIPENIEVIGNITDNPELLDK